MAMAQEASDPYAGGWLTWPKMTGDWGGLRTDLAEKGITLDIDVTQVFQSNMHGGRSTRSAAKYSGSSVIELKLDTGKMNLWPGGSFTFLADAVWGGGIDRKVGALIPTNLNAALPGSAEDNFGFDEGCRFMLSEFFYTQVLFEGKLILLGGKLWGARAFDTNVFANNHRTQFMNTALRNNVMIPTFLPYTTLGVGAIVNPTEWLSILTAVADTDGRAKTTGFETAFHGDTNTTVIHEWALKIKPFGLPGNQRIGFVWSSKNFDKVRPNEPFGSTGDLAIGLLGKELAMKVVENLATFDDAGDNIMIFYNFDQYLYTEDDDASQGIGVFGRFGWARQNVNPVAHFYSIGVGGTGVIPTRDKDTCGIGYYFMDLSNKLPGLFHSEQGIECYYNIEITPWLHVSPDLQLIVNPGGTDEHDVSIVGGIRVQMDL
jgi:porin